MSEAMARAKAKYYQNNKEKCKEQIKKAKLSYCENNKELWMEKNRINAKKHYYMIKDKEYAETTIKYIRYLFKK